MPTSRASVIEAMMRKFTDIAVFGPYSYVIANEKDKNIEVFATYSKKKEQISGKFKIPKISCGICGSKNNICIYYGHDDHFTYVLKEWWEYYCKDCGKFTIVEFELQRNLKDGAKR